MGSCTSTPERATIVLLGKTGDGKSSAGNTILKQKLFMSDASSASVTNKCTSGDRNVNGKKITVIDTPGFMDTSTNEEDIKRMIITSVIECAPGPDVFTIVLKVGRYTEHEMEIVDKMLEFFGEDTFKHSVVLFTHGEQLEGQTIEEFVKRSSKLQELVDKCGGRCHVIDSKYWNKRYMGYKSNKVQVENLLLTVEQKLKDNESTCYNNDLLKTVEEEIQEEIKNIKEENMSPEEKREEAKKIVTNKFLIKLAGVTTGTLIGAFFGIGVPIASVVALLKTGKNKEAVAGATGVAAGTVMAKAAGVEAAKAAGGAAAKAAGVAAAKAAGGAAAKAAGGAAAKAAGVAAAKAAGGAAAKAAGVAAAKAGVAAGIGAAGPGVAVGTILGAAAVVGAIGGGVTGYKAAKDVDSVSDAIKNAVKLNYDNAKGIVKKAENLKYKVFKNE
ncbi:GTPase IMAP family member 7-like [Misgurnus anguillicaudatus]|uniref:GTPase IMAP family member 7-like n=1 Tax=Misgurnus anguillicaudatus TaxID=75329 RepID=UPI003CCF9BA5